MDRRSFIGSVLAAGAVSLLNNKPAYGQSPPPLPNAVRLEQINLDASQAIISNIQNYKPLITTMVDMDLTSIFHSINSGLNTSNYNVSFPENTFLAIIESENTSNKFAYNISQMDLERLKSMRGVNTGFDNFKTNVAFKYTGPYINDDVSSDLWIFSSWTLEGIVNGEEFIVTYQVDNRKTLYGEGHLGKKKVRVDYEYEKDTDLFAKRRKTVIGDKTYITEFESKNGAYLSYVVSKQ